MKVESEEELAAILAETTGPVRIIGGGTRDVGRPVTGEVLSVSAMSGVVLYEPGALTLVVKAGTPLAEVKSVLAVEGQRLAFEPMDHRVLLGTKGTPTIGGVVATNVSGPRRVQAGACRDFLLGVRLVDGMGRVLKSGGRVMKNVTGYDLVKVLAGSWGTLGVLTEVSFKVLAIPEAEASVVWRGLDTREGIERLTRAMGSPFDVSGTAHAPAGILDDTAITLVRIEGMSASVRYRSEQLVGTGAEIVYGDESADLWRKIRDVEPFAGRGGAVWRLSVKPTDGPVISAALRGELPHDALFDWSGGLVWLLVDDEGDAGAAAIRDQLSALGGHATLIRAKRETRASVSVFQPQPRTVAEIEREIRAKFDPRGILNPGLMD